MKIILGVYFKLTNGVIEIDGIDFRKNQAWFYNEKEKIPIDLNKEDFFLTRAIYPEDQFQILEGSHYKYLWAGSVIEHDYYYSGDHKRPAGEYRIWDEDDVNELNKMDGDAKIIRIEE